MKRITLLMACFVVLSSQAFAQKIFSFGPRVGVSSSTLNIKDSDGYRFDSEGAQLGFHAGAFARISIPVIGIYVQPEVLFTSNSGKVNVNGPSVTDQIRNYDFNRIDVPIMIGFKTAKVLRFNVGPSFSYLLSAKEDGTSIKEDYKNSTIGYQAGIGLDLGPLLVDLKYEGNLSKFGEQITIVEGTSFNTDQRVNQFILSLGFRL